MTVIELINELAKYSSDADVLITWEGTFQAPSVYLAKGGTVIIDADDDFYREQIESGDMTPR